MESRSDADLVATVLAGDVEAFGALVSRYRDRHTRFVVRVLGNRDDADDVLQSVFMRAFRNLASCHGAASFGAWVHQIVVNECRTFAARRGRRERKFVHDDAAAEHSVTGDPAGSDALREEIQLALDRLPPEQREAFVLKHVEELSYEEMAGLTGVGVSALKMRVKRACERLRELLEGVLHD